MFALGALGLALVLTASAVLAPARGRMAVPSRTPPLDEVLAKVDPVDPPSTSALADGDPAPTLDPLPAALQLARRQVETSRRRGDPRFLGRAQAALAPWWDQAAPPDEVLLLRATIRQGLHDFAAARGDLDLLLGHRPDDAQALVTRAVVAMVTGDVARASADCARLGELQGDLLALACAAPLASRGGGARIAFERLGQLLAGARGPVVAWATTARGELARQLGDDREAERLLRQALTLSPGDPYTLVVLADLLLDAGRADEVDALLRDETAETLVLRRAIALHRLGRPEATALAVRLRAEIDASLARGDDTHLRERARYFLDVDRQPARALAAAVGNWNLQREPIDVRTLLEAAAAASQPLAAAPALAWLEVGAIDDAVLTRARARLEGGP